MFGGYNGQRRRIEKEGMGGMVMGIKREIVEKGKGIEIKKE